MRAARTLGLILGLLCLAGSVNPAAAQDRDTKVRADREKIAELGGWIYNDLDAGIKAARDENKPLLVVFRCIPCEACQEFDDDVARRDDRVRGLLDKFVCVRIVQGNALDLSRFQHDFDQSFAITMMNADGTIYARFGTRSNRDDESQDISLEGLRETLEEVLRLHENFSQVKPALAGKRVAEYRFAKPLEYPSLKGKYQATLSESQGQVARSCVHCHQIAEAERVLYRDNGEPIPDKVLFPYPNPRVLGLDMDPTHMATVKTVAPDSEAETAGFEPGDRIVTASGQPILSTADLQWILHHAPDSARLDFEIERDHERLPLQLSLKSGWRRRGDLSWRATTWDLRKMALGGLHLVATTTDERRTLGVPPGKMALRAEHVGEYGDHAVALKAGLRKGDIIVAFDGRDDFTTESELIAYAVQRKRRGDEVTIAYLRDGARREAKIVLQ